MPSVVAVAKLLMMLLLSIAIVNYKYVTIATASNTAFAVAASEVSWTLMPIAL